MSSFLHSGDLGDIIYALPTIKHLGGGMLYLTSQPNTREPMTQARFEFIRPLLEAQPYLRAVEMHKGQQVKHDFTGFREGHVSGVTLAELQRRHVQPIGARPDFSQPWLTATPLNQNRRLVIARSPRYHNPKWEPVWAAVAERAPLFLGLPEEHAAFERAYGKVDYLCPSSARHVAELIAGASGFIGNQSLFFAIAEGLKAPRVLEVCERADDCRYRGGDVKHIIEATDFLPDENLPLMIALQVYPGDFQEGLELARLLVEIEPRFRTDVVAAVCVRDDVPAEQAAEIEAELAQRFSTFVLRSKRSGRGWPDGCNDLWQSTMQQLNRLKAERRIKAEAVLTFEPDCLPLRRDWLAVLRAEWRKAKSQGKLAFGAHHEGGRSSLHINGNMVLATDAIRRHPELQTSHGSWDIYHAKLFLDHGVDSSAIVNCYQDRRELTAADLGAIQKHGETPALAHGFKSPTRWAAARDLLCRA